MQDAKDKIDQGQPAPERQENMLLNLALNILIPTFILIKGSGEEYLGPTWGVIIALSFPIGYGVYDFFGTKKVNIFSVIGVISVMLTGGISLLKLPLEYMAIKEAAIPGILGLIVLGSLYTPYPLVKTLLFNKKFMNVDKIHLALESYSNEKAFEKVLKLASLMLASSFFLSSALNYILAKWILQSPPGTPEYNAELGKMTALSFPVITIPSMLVLLGALFFLMYKVTHLTKLSLDEIMIEPPEKPKKHKNENS